jgi:mannose-6-phosphate isomerase-like protein (cupin superfamily)
MLPLDRSGQRQGLAMKRYTPTQDEMKSRIARFKDVVPTKARHALDKGIPPEVLEMITAKTTRNIMSPGALPGTLSPKPSVIGGDAGVFRLGIVTCPPGNGPGLHVHYKTHETFMALTGKWEIQWGDKGEETTLLEPFDLIAVPPRVTRRFVNVGSEDAHLLVIIQGKAEEFDDVDRVPGTAAAIAAKHGAQMVRTLESLGWKFTIGVEEPVA